MNYTSYIQAIQIEAGLNPSHPRRVPIPIDNCVGHVINKINKHNLPHKTPQQVRYDIYNTAQF